MQFEPGQSVRVDKWLWAVRLFKSRSQASAACESGRVKRAGQSLKPASPVKAGDRLEVPAHDNSFLRQVEVVLPIEKRVGAPDAQRAYTDHTPAEVLEAAKEARSQALKSYQFRREGDQGRMTKKQRRTWASQLHGFSDP